MGQLQAPPLIALKHHDCKLRGTLVDQKTGPVRVCVWSPRSAAFCNGNHGPKQIGTNMHEGGTLVLLESQSRHDFFLRWKQKLGDGKKKRGIHMDIFQNEGQKLQPPDNMRWDFFFPVGFWESKKKHLFWRFWPKKTCFWKFWSGKVHAKSRRGNMVSKNFDRYVIVCQVCLGKVLPCQWWLKCDLWRNRMGMKFLQQQNASVPATSRTADLVTHVHRSCCNDSGTGRLSWTIHWVKQTIRNAERSLNESHNFFSVLSRRFKHQIF